VQTFNYSLTVSVKGAATGMVSGRIVEDTNDSSNMDEAKALSLRKVSADLVKGEALWPEPLNDLLAKAPAKAPFTFRWLVYSEKEALGMAMQYVKSLNTKESAFGFVAWTKNSLEKGDTADKVFLKGTISISANELIGATPGAGLAPIASSTLAADATSTATSTQAVENQNTATSSLNTANDNASILVAGYLATVKSTETGWLNVRKGPGANYDVVVKINPGEQYKILDKKGDWANLELKDGTNGWVKTSYLK